MSPGWLPQRRNGQDGTRMVMLRLIFSITVNICIHVCIRGMKGILFYTRVAHQKDQQFSIWLCMEARQKGYDWAPKMFNNRVQRVKIHWNIQHIHIYIYIYWLDTSKHFWKYVTNHAIRVDMLRRLRISYFDLISNENPSGQDDTRMAGGLLTMDPRIQPGWCEKKLQKK